MKQQPKSGWKQTLRQVDRRTSAERRSYMQEYHARRRRDNGADANLPHVSIPEMPRCPPPRDYSLKHGFILRDEEARRHLRDGSGRLMWPERRKQFPETLAETARRVRR